MSSQRGTHPRCVGLPGRGAVLGSALVALTLIPALCLIFFRSGQFKEEEPPLGSPFTVEQAPRAGRVTKV